MRITFNRLMIRTMALYTTVPDQPKSVDVREKRK